MTALTWAVGCTTAPSPEASTLQKKLLACEAAPAATCRAEAASYDAHPDAPEQYYVKAFADACDVGGVANCETLVQWTSGVGGQPVPQLRANCEQGAVASCRAAATLLAEDEPEQATSLKRLADRFTTGETCGDLLASAGATIEGVTFLACRPGQAAQLDAHVAEYRIRGADRSHAVAALVQRTGIQQPRFVCCGDESPPHFFTGTGGASYEVTLNSWEEHSEVGEAARADLRLVVKRLLQEP